MISFLGPEAASAAADVQVGDSNALLKFVKNYGTHYFKSVTIGDAIYQVFAVSKDQMQKLKSSLGGRKTVGLREWSSLHENYLGMSYRIVLRIRRPLLQDDLEYKTINFKKLIVLYLHKILITLSIRRK